LKNTHEIWKTINNIYGGTKDVSNETYHVLIDLLNSFKQLDHEDAEAMYLGFNVLINEINSLCIKQIEDVDTLFEG
jgi:hypothetical protein